jgi:hypothetical protein
VGGKASTILPATIKKVKWANYRLKLNADFARGGKNGTRDWLDDKMAQPVLSEFQKTTKRVKEAKSPIKYPRRK